ncbi:hypothetical protein NIES2100_38940 [Calothrix sp. NIES-2100]|uniref:effector-associated domain EAD1-containing protein n=1 Tax=Calothrix sp. NIES-2100 TaxID=1954172 RepID=UPI000B5DFB03|nr:hypothetical protein NIES2100_38940 [Calothrix sp. NIES-2100]
MGLAGQQREELQDALIDAFPDTASLERMLSFKLNKNLRVIAGEGNLQDIVFQLIQTANSQEWVEDLVRAACNSNPGNQRLRAVAKRLLLNHRRQKPSASSSPFKQKQLTRFKEDYSLIEIRCRELLKKLHELEGDRNYTASTTQRIEIERQITLDKEKLKDYDTQLESLAQKIELLESEVQGL